MLNVTLMRGQKSGHREYDYIMVSGLPEDIAELIESLSRQLVGHMRTGHEGQRSEPRFNGTLLAPGKDKERIGGYFSIAISSEMRCAHPGCRDAFDWDSKPAAAFRKAGLVCKEHENDARIVVSRKETP